MKQETLKAHIIRIIFIAIGSVIAAFAVEEILLPQKILDGGVVGVSIILHSCFPIISLGMLTMLLNLPFVLIGGKKLGKDFLIYTGTGMVVFSAFVVVFEHSSLELEGDQVLASVFGGALLGVGVGIVIKNGGCLDGTEAVAILISKKLHVSVGQIVLGFNVVIYMTAALLFGLNSALYSILTYFITSRIVDFIDTGLDQAKAVMIITNEGKQIAADIYESLGRTVTFIKGEGLISGEKTILYCVITRLELGTLRRIIQQVDYRAFLTVSDVSEIIGSHIKSRAMEEKIKESRSTGQAEE